MADCPTATPGPELDLDAYLRRIDYSGPLDTTLHTLQGLVYRHTTSIAFENLNPLLGRPVSLELEALQQKLVRSGRGGYCYEQNGLFSKVLQRLGFPVTYLAARVVWNQPDDAPTPRSHMLLKVEVEGEAYLVDVGFGAMTPTSGLRFTPDVEQTTPHEPFRLQRAGDMLLMQAAAGGEWKSLYRFDFQEQLPADYEVANWYVSTHPQSIFTNNLIASRADTGRRHTLINRELNTYPLEGKPERRVLASTGEIREALEEVFRLRVPEGPEVERVLQQAVERAA